jgi:hypothetical protein
MPFLRETERNILSDSEYDPRNRAGLKRPLARRPARPCGRDAWRDARRDARRDAGSNATRGARKCRTPRVTEFGNVNVKARVDSRNTRSTHLVDDSNSRGQTITRAEYDRVAAIQDAHIAESHMVVVDGYIGSDPQFRPPGPG